MKDKTILVITTLICLLAAVSMTYFKMDHSIVAWIITGIFAACTTIQYADEAETNARGCRMFQSEL